MQPSTSVVELVRAIRSRTIREPAANASVLMALGGLTVRKLRLILPTALATAMDTALANQKRATSVFATLGGLGQAVMFLFVPVTATGMSVEIAEFVK